MDTSGNKLWSQADAKVPNREFHVPHCRNSGGFLNIVAKLCFKSSIIVWSGCVSAVHINENAI